MPRCSGRKNTYKPPAPCCCFSKCTSGTANSSLPQKQRTKPSGGARVDRQSEKPPKATTKSSLKEHIRMSPVSNSAVSPVTFSFSSITATISDTPPNVVLDGQNIARFRRQEELSKSRTGLLPSLRASQLEKALQFFESKGKKPVIILPQATIDTRNGSKSNFQADARNRHIINRLHREGKLFFNPAGTHDDYYTVSFGMRNRIPVISNDKFNPGNVSSFGPKRNFRRQQSDEEERALRKFLKRCRCEFEFDTNGVFSLRSEPCNFNLSE